MRKLLEINDVGLVVADAGGTLANSPGQIICGEGSRDALRVGRAASELRRINPRATHDRFWAALDQAPLPQAAGSARSNADLVWLHLRELLTTLERDADASWILVVPTAYDDDQLALLLGIARSLAMRVDRMVSAPVAAAAASGAATSTLVIDAHWHRFSSDRVDASGAAYRLDPDAVSDSRAPGGRGLGALFDAWASVINDSFVAQTRFDPSHDARIEQDLYNRLPAWLSRIKQGEDVVAELNVDKHRYRAELSPGALMAAAEPFYRVLIDRIRRAGADTLVLRHRLAGLPGLTERIAEAGFTEPRWLEEHAVARTVLELPAAGADGATDAVPLTLELDLGAGLRDDTGAPAMAATAVPSHVLVAGSALAIDEAGRALTGNWRIERDSAGRVVLATERDASARTSARINGRPAEAGTVLEIGDRVAVGGDGNDDDCGNYGQQEFVLLRVADGGPA